MCVHVRVCVCVCVSEMRVLTCMWVGARVWAQVCLHRCAHAYGDLKLTVVSLLTSLYHVLLSQGLLMNPELIHSSWSNQPAGEPLSWLPEVLN